MSRIHIALAFALGACAGTTASTVADTPPAPPLDAAEAKTAPAPVAAEPAVAEVRRAAATTTRWHASGTASITELARGHNAFLGRLTMAAGGEVPVHRDATEEYIHVVQGGGVITIDGTPSTIAAGDTVFMPANAEVGFANGDAELVAIQVFAGPAPAAKYDSWQVEP